jgi:O-antigen biosynthesis protein
MEGYVNIDIRPECKPDLVADLSCGLPFFRDDSVEKVAAVDFLEHVPIGRVVPLIEEIYRVLKSGGVFESMTPSTDGRGAFQDPTHVSFWNMNSWIYYSDDAYRALYGIRAKFRGTVRDLITDERMNVIHTHAILEAVK